MTTLVVLPVLIPVLTAAVCLMGFGRRRFQQWLSLAALTALLAVAVILLVEVSRAGIQVAQPGNWPAPFGITLVVDLFSAIMLVLASLMGLAVGVYSSASMDRGRLNFGYYPFLMILLLGVNGAFLAGDIFNLYVWFEVMLIASFVLISMGGGREQIAGAFKYVALNLVSSALFVSGVGLLYAATGTLNMAGLAVQFRAADAPSGAALPALLFLVAFGIKAAIFPLFFWLPASYHTPPIGVSAVFAGLLTKVGVYSLIRVFTLIFVQDAGFTHALILLLSGATMITGVLGAVAQDEIRRILSFHIVSQIGYMLMGLGLFTPLALAGSVFYIAHHIIVKTNLFLIGGLARRIGGSYELKRLGQLASVRPFLGVLFLVAALSLAGVPPLSGFFAKLILIRAGLEGREYGIVAVALGVSLLTLYSMTKIWSEAFWKERPAAAGPEERAGLPMWAPAAGLAALTVAIGAGAGPLFALSLRAAEQLMNPSDYVRAVLGVAL